MIKNTQNISRNITLRKSEYRRPSWLTGILSAACLCLASFTTAVNAETTLNIHNGGDPTSLDPHKLSGDWENRIAGDIFEGLVVNKLLVAKAEIDSVIVLEPEVDSNLDQRMQMIISQVGGNEQALENYYGKSLVDIRNELRESVREQLIIQRMQNTITN